MLSRGFRSPRVLVGAHRVPEPPYELVRLATHATSMIDISDGLVSDLSHIAKASGVSINIKTAEFDIPEISFDIFLKTFEAWSMAFMAI